MSDSQKAYRHILKATSLFSGVQFLNIIFSIIRSKVAALLIGPVGIGIIGVLNSTINLISGFTKLGLDVSSVKEISIAHENNDAKRSSEVINTLRRILWITGILGTLTTILLSSWLSQLTFGNNDYTFSFFWISIAILFKQLTIGNFAVLQGLRKLKNLAKANLISSFVSVLVVIPLYYFFGIDGIVPVIIINAFLIFLIASYFAKNYKPKAESKSLKEILSSGKGMMKLGIVLSLSNLISLVVAYVMQIFVVNIGGTTELGFYNAGIIIVNSYVGLIFNAMSKDYFPRLAAISDNNEEIKKIITYQASIAILLLTPIIVIFLILMPFIIELIYSKEFLPVIGFLTFAILGTLFKAVSWSMGYVIIAKADSKIFIKTAIGFNALQLIMSILAYNYYGLTGLGISLLVYYFLHYVIVKIILKKRYQLFFNRQFNIIYAFCIVICAMTYLASLIDNVSLRYLLMVAMALISFIFTTVELNKKIDLKALIKSFVNRNNERDS